MRDSRLSAWADPQALPYRIVRKGPWVWYALWDVPGLISGRPARYQMGLGPYRFRRSAERAARQAFG